MERNPVPDTYGSDEQVITKTYFTLNGTENSGLKRKFY